MPQWIGGADRDRTTGPDQPARGTSRLSGRDDRDVREDRVSAICGIDEAVVRAAACAEGIVTRMGRDAGSFAGGSVAPLRHRARPPRKALRGGPPRRHQPEVR